MGGTRTARHDTSSNQKDLQARAHAMSGERSGLGMVGDGRGLEVVREPARA